MKRNSPSPNSQNGEFLCASSAQNGVSANTTKSSSNQQQSAGKKRIYKVVLTGGPCGGKTTGQDRLATFFENLGWKVYRVPETATVLLKGGVRFADLSPEQCERFQEDLLLALIRIENVYFDLAEGACKNEDPANPHNVLIICDRGTMDGSAYIEPPVWEKILKRNNLNEVDIRDRRYDQIIHMVTAAIGAEHFYTQANNAARSEDTKLAGDVDMRTRQVWVGHPYVDVIDNQTTRNFEDKILRMLQEFPKYQEFDVIHYYLSVLDQHEQARIRQRGQNGKFCYTHTVRRIIAGERVETRMQVSQREYEALKKHVDPLRFGTKKKRRCFLYGETYFQLDIYKPPIPRGMKSLMILETYTTDESAQFIKLLPPFLTIDREITSDAQYSLYNLSLKE